MRPSSVDEISPKANSIASLLFQHPVLYLHASEHLETMLVALHCPPPASGHLSLMSFFNLISLLLLNWDNCFIALDEATKPAQPEEMI